MVLNSDAQNGPPPTIAVQPLGVSVQNGGTAVLTATAISATKMGITWYCNGQKLVNPNVLNVDVPLVGTVSTLTIGNATSSSAGSYYMNVTNKVGSVNSSNATLVVLGDVVPVTLNIVSGVAKMTTSGFNLQLSGPAGSNYVIEASTDLKNWVPISTNAAPSGTVSYTDTAATNMVLRYYRARIE